MSIAWSFGGTTLSSFGTVTLMDDYMDIAPRRGDNRLIPFQDGKAFAKKFYDERKITFGIAILSTSATAQDTVIDNMKKLFAVQAEQTLSCTREDGTVRTAPASVNAPMEVQRVTPTFANAVIEFSLSYPIFRLSTAIADNTTTINASPKAMTVTNPGTVRETRPTVVLTGPLQNTVITNSTNGCVLTYTGTIASPRVVTLSFNTTTGEWVATDDLGANKISLFSHSGDASMFVVDVGANTLSIADSTHTTGSVKITFSAPFL